MALCEPKTRFVVVAPLFCSLALQCLAQTPPLPVRPSPSAATSAARIVPATTPGALPLEAVTAAAPQDPAAAAAAAAATAKLQKWKTLLYDRRPSTILQAWAAPELKPYDPAEEKKPDSAKPAASPE